jgi:peptide/nickel transport system substrate-binding protein
MLALLAALGCARQAPRKASRVVVGTTAEPDGLSSLRADNAATAELALLCLRELTGYEAAPEGGWRLVPDLAVRVPTLENGDARLVDDGGQERLVVTWRLRPDARWEDGAPVVAEDFLAGFALQREGGDKVTGQDIARKIARMERGDDGSLVVTWREAHPFFNDFRVHRAVPAHVLKQQAARPPRAVLDELSKKPLCNGPFRLARWTPGEGLLFVRNPHAAPAPVVDEVLVRIGGRAQALATWLKAGEIDLALPAAGLSSSEAAELAASAPDAIAAARAPGLVWAHLDLRLDDPVLQDVRVRRAIALGIDRARLVKAIFGPDYVVAETFLPPGHWGARAGARLPYDPTRARALLDEAGYAGKRIALTLAAASEQRDATTFLEGVVHDLAAIGIDVTLDLRPFKVFFGEGVRHRKYAQMAFYAWVLDPSTFGATMWSVDSIPNADNGWQGQNVPGWKNVEVTQLLEAAGHTLSLPERQRLLGRVQELFEAELPAIPVYFRPVIAAHRKDLQGVAPTGTQTPITWNAAQWRFTGR